MENIRSAKNLITPNAFMTAIDLKDAYFLVPVNNAYKKYLRFKFNKKLYQFTCLPFGLCTSPYICTKIMKPVMNELRQEGCMSIIYLDDILCIGNIFKACQNNVVRSIALLKSLGFIINLNKSHLVPKQKYKYLSFVLNLKDFTLELSDTKKENVLELISRMRVRKPYKIRDVAQLLGTLSACSPAVVYSISQRIVRD